MTAAQRKMHLVLWLLLGPVALVGLILAVMWRPSAPVQPGTAPGTEASAAVAQDTAGVGDE
ncbi:MAG: hypothetical protein ACIAXF_08235 [Phycisphaerales bacterium JB063]